MPFSIKIYQNLVFWHAISFQAGRYPNLEKQKHNWEQKGKRNELISKPSKTCEVEFAALKNRLTDIKSELQEAFVVLLRLYDGMWQHDVYLRKPSGMNSTWKVEVLLSYLTGYQSQQRPPENTWATSHRQEESWNLRPEIFGVRHGPNYYKLLILCSVSFVYGTRFISRQMG